MWPFRTRSNHSADPGASESFASGAELAELRREFKVMQRELDDLHAAYRRIRAGKAGETAIANRTTVTLPDEQPVDKKTALRAKARAMLRSVASGSPE